MLRHTCRDFRRAHRKAACKPSASYPLPRPAPSLRGGAADAAIQLPSFEETDNRNASQAVLAIALSARRAAATTNLPAHRQQRKVWIAASATPPRNDASVGVVLRHTCRDFRQGTPESRVQAQRQLPRPAPGTVIARRRSRRGNPAAIVRRNRKQETGNRQQATGTPIRLFWRSPCPRAGLLRLLTCRRIANSATGLDCRVGYASSQ